MPIVVSTSPRHCDGMNKAMTSESDIDRIARAMASRAGVVWDHLNAYPGYERGRWRGEARRLLALGDQEVRRAA